MVNGPTQNPGPQSDLRQACWGQNEHSYLHLAIMTPCFACPLQTPRDPASLGSQPCGAKTPCRGSFPQIGRAHV